MPSVSCISALSHLIFAAEPFKHLGIQTHDSTGHRVFIGFPLSENSYLFLELHPTGWKVSSLLSWIAFSHLKISLSYFFKIIYYCGSTLSQLRGKPEILAPIHVPSSPFLCPHCSQVTIEVTSLCILPKFLHVKHRQLQMRILIFPPFLFQRSIKTDCSALWGCWVFFMYSI